MSSLAEKHGKQVNIYDTGKNTSMIVIPQDLNFFLNPSKIQIGITPTSRMGSLFSTSFNYHHSSLLELILGRQVQLELKPKMIADTVKCFLFIQINKEMKADRVTFFPVSVSITSFLLNR